MAAKAIKSLELHYSMIALNHIYRSLIQPYLLYGTVAWGQAAQILILQKRAFRLMYFGDYRSHAIPFFVSFCFFLSFGHALL